MCLRMDRDGLNRDFSILFVGHKSSRRMSRRSSFGGNRDITMEERKRVLAAKNQLSKGENESERIIEGFQILDVANIVLFKV